MLGSMIGKLQAGQAASPLSSLQIATVLERLKDRKTIFALAALLLALAVTVVWTGALRSSAASAYVTEPVVRQDLTQTITASGTVNPQDTVQIGTQVSGTISQLYVDYNSHVKKGQVLAKIDPSQFLAQLSQAQAALAQARAQAAQQAQSASGAQATITEAQQTSAAQTANAQAAQASIASAQANVSKAQSAAQLAQQTVTRDSQLLSNGYISQSQYDSDKASAESAAAGVQSAQAALTQAQAQAAASANQAAASATQTQVSSAQAGASQDAADAAQAAVQVAQAQVAQDELNLQRTVITSPVDGTVISRAVSVGQTVAASLQTPTLFSIAQDLKKMEVDIAVGEPDIGNVRPGDTVSFSVLAYEPIVQRRRLAGA
ncbi:MAG TPA: biotin/lipoyl-binding protein [Candidatus Baltobacteraceae bacterium]|jgi:HlyD family secretion protein|nr:biotin/lipoyl-binding protein [Candidatus Baltobacteraceae bacterium]